MDDAGIERPTLLKAGMAEDGEHCLVLEEGVSLEALDSHIAGPLGKETEKIGSDPVTLPWVSDDEGDLSVGGARGSVEACDRHKRSLDDGDERFAVAVIDMGEPFYFGAREMSVGAEEAESLRFVGQAFVEGDQRFRVICFDRPDRYDCSVSESDFSGDRLV